MGMAGWMAGRALREHGVGMHLKVYQAPAAMGPPTRGIGREQRDQQKTINPSLVVLWVSLSESCFSDTRSLLEPWPWRKGTCLARNEGKKKEDGLMAEADTSISSPTLHPSQSLLRGGPWPGSFRRIVIAVWSRVRGRVLGDTGCGVSEGESLSTTEWRAGGLHATPRVL